VLVGLSLGGNIAQEVVRRAPGRVHALVVADATCNTADMDVTPDHGEQTYRGTGRLAGKKAVITGGDSGIGRAVAIAFARGGADVLITNLEAEKDDGQETMSWVTQTGQRGLAVPVDLREEQQCRALVDRAVQEFGQIDIRLPDAPGTAGSTGSVANSSTG